MSTKLLRGDYFGEEVQRLPRGVVAGEVESVRTAKGVLEMVEVAALMTGLVSPSFRKQDDTEAATNPRLPTSMDIK